MTNGDYIRNMSDEELAEWLDKRSNESREDWDPIGCDSCTFYETHHYPKECGDCKWKNGIIGWLKSEKIK